MGSLQHLSLAVSLWPPMWRNCYLLGCLLKMMLWEIVEIDLFCLYCPWAKVMLKLAEILEVLIQLLLLLSWIVSEAFARLR